VRVECSTWCMNSGMGIQLMVVDRSQMEEHT
jgi:hypothetical protein